jgi:hypothetical protein
MSSSSFFDACVQVNAVMGKTKGDRRADIYHGLMDATLDRWMQSQEDVKYILFHKHRHILDGHASIQWDQMDKRHDVMAFRSSLNYRMPCPLPDGFMTADMPAHLIRKETVFRDKTDPVVISAWRADDVTSHEFNSYVYIQGHHDDVDIPASCLTRPLIQSIITAKADSLDYTSKTIESILDTMDPRSPASMDAWSFLNKQDAWSPAIHTWMGTSITAMTGSGRTLSGTHWNEIAKHACRGCFPSCVEKHLVSMSPIHAAIHGPRPTSSQVDDLVDIIGSEAARHVATYLSSDMHLRKMHEPTVIAWYGSMIRKGMPIYGAHAPTHVVAAAQVMTSTDPQASCRGYDVLKTLSTGYKVPVPDMDKAISPTGMRTWFTSLSHAVDMDQDLRTMVMPVRDMDPMDPRHGNLVTTIHQHPHAMIPDAVVDALVTDPTAIDTTLSVLKRHDDRGDAPSRLAIRHIGRCLGAVVERHGKHDPSGRSWPFMSMRRAEIMGPIWMGVVRHQRTTPFVTTSCPQARQAIAEHADVRDQAWLQSLTMDDILGSHAPAFRSGTFINLENTRIIDAMYGLGETWCASHRQDLDALVDRLGTSDMTILGNHLPACMAHRIEQRMISGSLDQLPAVHIRDPRICFMEHIDHRHPDVLAANEQLFMSVPGCIRAASHHKEIGYASSMAFIQGYVHGDRRCSEHMASVAPWMDPMAIIDASRDDYRLMRFFPGFTALASTEFYQATRVPWSCWDPSVHPEVWSMLMEKPGFHDMDMRAASMLFPLSLETTHETMKGIPVHAWIMEDPRRVVGMKACGVPDDAIVVWAMQEASSAAVIMDMVNRCASAS